MKNEDMFASTDEFLDWAAGEVLAGFVLEGGKGMRTAIWQVCVKFSEWNS